MYLFSIDREKFFKNLMVGWYDHGPIKKNILSGDFWNDAKFSISYVYACLSPREILTSISRVSVKISGIFPLFSAPRFFIYVRARRSF